MAATVRRWLARSAWSVQSRSMARTQTRTIFCFNSSRYEQLLNNTPHAVRSTFFLSPFAFSRSYIIEMHYFVWRSWTWFEPIQVKGDMGTNLNRVDISCVEEGRLWYLFYGRIEGDYFFTNLRGIVGKMLLLTATCLQFNQNLGSEDAEMLAEALNYMSQLTTLNLVSRVNADWLLMASIKNPKMTRMQTLNVTRKLDWLCYERWIPVTLWLENNLSASNAQKQQNYTISRVSTPFLFSSCQQCMRHARQPGW